MYGILPCQFENAVGMTGGKCLNLFIVLYNMCNQRLLVGYWPGLNVLTFVLERACVARQ
ncbi:hypothetical protein BDV41DRAFT_554907 [Aspergillus transmontanensis]|uniref:Uncharacterized protein n=1 Tax=Aspergillus transmontanensis TaxID=1034304 RepID=A0A5N6VG24_9EURO|nr:hypothetical protein BDV41DRAFT_554907 [Aspergillus transmontanensis]